jgi:hypothetical protein
VSCPSSDFPVLTPRQVARELRVPIETTDDPMVGSIWRFAEYRPRPPHIMLYDRGIAPLERTLAGSLTERLRGRATPRDVFVARTIPPRRSYSVGSPDRPALSAYIISNWQLAMAHRCCGAGRDRSRRLCAIASRSALPPQSAGFRCRRCDLHLPFAGLPRALPR